MPFLRFDLDEILAGNQNNSPEGLLVVEADAPDPAFVFVAPEAPEFTDGAVVREIGVIPGLNLLWGYPAEIQVTRAINEHPTASIKFYAYQLPTITIGSLVNIIGINFVIDSYTTTEYLIDYNRVFVINLSLVGEHAPRGSAAPEHELDCPIKFDYDTTDISWGDIDSKVSTAISIGSTDYRKYYNGQGEVELTPRGELEAAILLSSRPLAIYSEPIITNRPVTTTAVGIIPREYILDETIEIQYNTPPKYNDTELQLETIESVGEPEVVERLEFENCLDFADLTSPGGAGGAVTPDIAEDLKNPGNVFDNGGRTKTLRRITEKDGSPLQMLETTYGYVFISFEMFDMPRTPVQIQQFAQQGFKWALRFRAFQSVIPYWKIVQTTTTQYHYDSDGYLIGSTKSGWKLGRLKRESGEYETANLYLETMRKSASVGQQGQQDSGAPPKWKAAAREFNAYCFSNPISTSGNSPVFAAPGGDNLFGLFRYSILENNFYFLEEMRQYYSDIEVVNNQHQPKFVYRNYNYTSDQEIRPNPKDEQGDPGAPYPPLIAHKERKETTVTQIQIPVSQDSDKRTPEIFTTTTYTQSIEGDHSSSSLVIGNRNQSIGRPSQQSRLPDDVNTPNLPANHATFARNRYFVNSSSNTPDVPVNPVARIGGGGAPAAKSSLSFTGAVTPDAALKGAKNQLARDYLSSKTMTIRVPFFRYYQVLKEGYCWEVDNVSWIITSISFNLTLIQDGIYSCPEGLTVTLGNPYTPSVSMRTYSRN